MRKDKDRLHEVVKGNRRTGHGNQELAEEKSKRRLYIRIGLLGASSPADGEGDRKGDGVDTTQTALECLGLGDAVTTCASPLIDGTHLVAVFGGSGSSLCLGFLCDGLIDLGSSGRLLCSDL